MKHDDGHRLFGSEVNGRDVLSVAQFLGGLANTLSRLISYMYRQGLVMEDSRNNHWRDARQGRYLAKGYRHNKFFEARLWADSSLRWQRKLSGNPQRWGTTSLPRVSSKRSLSGSATTKRRTQRRVRCI